MRRRLVDAAAHLLADSGPGALSARKVAAAAGTSTMAVYTHFGAMEHVVVAMVEEGFAMLERAFLEVAATDDPIRDVAAQTAVLLGFSAEYAELYAVMFGTAPLGQFRLPPPSQDQRGRRQTLDRVAANLARGVESGRLLPAPAADLSFQWWSLVHGYAVLRNAGFIAAGPGRGRVLGPALVALFAGLGDGAERAAASVGAGLG